MDIAADSYFCIGKTHLICQDYARHHGADNPYLIIADGCSSSADTDIGARLLALIAKRYLAQSEQFDPQDFARYFTASGLQYIEEFGIASETLDATLVIAYRDEQHICVYVYGDACVLAQKRDGQQQCFQIEYAHNAPYYLSYRLDAERRNNYRQALAENAASAQKLHCFNPSGAYQLDYVYDEPIKFHFDLENYQRVIIASDGLASFVDNNDGRRIALPELAMACLAIKNRNGEFIKRRLRRLLNQLARQNIHPLDDIAIAALAWE